MKNPLIITLVLTLVSYGGMAYAIDIGGCICDPWGCGETIPY